MVGCSAAQSTDPQSCSALRRVTTNGPAAISAAAQRPGERRHSAPAGAGDLPPVHLLQRLLAQLTFFYVMNVFRDLNYVMTLF